MMEHKHTPGPLTYELRYSGKDWQIARVDFGTQLDGSDFSGWITTDRTRASECIAGEPEADLRLWAGAAALLEAAQRINQRIAEIPDPPLRHLIEDELADELADIRAAIARATGREGE